MAAADLRAVKDEYPSRLSPVAVTFDAEIKRLAEEKGLSIERAMKKLSGFTGLSISQLYNYRSGKTPIPADLIPTFCKQFGSNALAMTVLAMCETTAEERDAFDLTRLCAKEVGTMLRFGDQFMESFDDGRIDGHEETRLSQSHAKIIRGANRMMEVVRAARQRNNNRPAAA